MSPMTTLRCSRRLWTACAIFCHPNVGVHIKAHTYCNAQNKPKSCDKTSNIVSKHNFSMLTTDTFPLNCQRVLPTLPHPLQADSSFGPIWDQCFGTLHQLLPCISVDIIRACLHPLLARSYICNCVPNASQCEFAKNAHLVAHTPMRAKIFGAISV